MFKKLLLAAAVSAVPLSASAATLVGLFNVDGGTVDLSQSDFAGGDAGTDDVVFSDSSIEVDSVLGFGNLGSILASGQTGTMTDVDFDTSGLIYTIDVGGGDTLTFTADVGSFHSIQDGPTTYAFSAVGTLSTTVDGFTDNSGTLMSFTAQDPTGGLLQNLSISFSAGTFAPIPLPAAGWMLIAGIGGLAAVRRRKKS